MENQEIKKKRFKSSNFTEQEDVVIKLAIENTRGPLHDRSVAASQAINRSPKSIMRRYYYLVARGEMEKLDIPRKPKDMTKREGQAPKKAPEVKSPKIHKPVKKQETKAPSKWRRIINILFDK